MTMVDEEEEVQGTKKDKNNDTTLTGTCRKSLQGRDIISAEEVM
jgi:hypothetical protein